MTFPQKHVLCPHCHHRTDYRRRSGAQRPHRCADTPTRRVGGKEKTSAITTAGHKRRSG